MDKKELSAAAGSAISFLFGVGLQMSGYQNAYLAFACFGLAGVLLLYLIALHFPSAKSIFDGLRRDELISLGEAAKIAYTELRDTPWGPAAADSSPDKTLNYMALGIACENVQIYGKWGPSNKHEPVDKKYFNQGLIGGGGVELNIRGGPSIKELAIKRADVKTAVAQMRIDAHATHS